jgi:hypothetical protein
MLTNPRRFLALCVALSLAAVQSAQAVELISAEQVVQRQQAAATGGEAPRERLRAVLDRSDVAAGLVERGVSLEQARERVAALTDAEASALLAEIDRAPAGASGEIIGTLILVLVVLVFSDILGFTRIFPFLRPAR